MATDTSGQLGSVLQMQIELSVETLSNVVQQPRLLAPRCLARPPFRFLHDVVSEVQRNTGFAPGLYQGDELDARAIHGKDAKVAYLFKIMTVVSLALGAPCPADPYKVVAGLEPEETNVFLQMLGKACTLTDAADIVQAVLQMEQRSQEEAEQQLHSSIQLPSPSPHSHLAGATPMPEAAGPRDSSGGYGASIGPGSMDSGKGQPVDLLHQDTGPVSPSRKMASLLAKARELPLFRAVFRRRIGPNPGGQANEVLGLVGSTPSSPRCLADGGSSTPRSTASCPPVQQQPEQPEQQYQHQQRQQRQRRPQLGVQQQQQEGKTQASMQATVQLQAWQQTQGHKQGQVQQRQRQATGQGQPRDLPGECFCEPEQAEVGCLPGLYLSEQVVRRVTQSTAAGLAMLRRNSSLVHPVKAT